MQIILDFVEIFAVFFLAVEAIKLDNLSKLTNKLLRPTLDKINPDIIIVEEEPEYISIFDKYWLEFNLGIFYLLGLSILHFVFLGFSFDFFGWLSGIYGVSWLWVVPSIIFIPLMVGSIPYQGIVFIFEISIKGLLWVERNTATGVVGIIGFFMYLLQFIGRKLLAS